MSWGQCGKRIKLWWMGGFIHKTQVYVQGLVPVSQTLNISYCAQWDNEQSKMGVTPLYHDYIANCIETPSYSQIK